MSIDSPDSRTEMTYPNSSGSRWLIVNADDFGMSAGVNEGIIESHERGIVSSASLMVRWPAAMEAAQYGAANKRLALGLHIDLGEWHCAANGWEPLYEVVSMNDAVAVREEIRRQLDRFRELVGTDPTHIDSHQHVHRGEPVHGMAEELAAEIGVPLRSFTPDIEYCGGFYGQAGQGEPWPEGISREGLMLLLEHLSPGITELGCHPGCDDDLKTMYCRERRREVEVLCDPEIADAIDRLQIERISYADVPTLRAARRQTDKLERNET